MRVVHLTSVHPPFDVRIFHKECNTLAAAGHQVMLIAPHDGDELVGKVAIRAVPKAGNRIARMTVGAWRVYREALRQPADAYHFHDPELIPAGLLLRAQGKKVVYDVHEDLPLDILAKNYLPRLLRRPVAAIADRLEKASSRVFSRVVPATPAIAQRFRHLNGQVAVVQNFPLPGEFAASPAMNWGSRLMSVAYAGSITRDRGIREMIDAIGLVPESVAATLSLAGAFYPVQLRRHMERRPGWRRVVELGVLSRPELGGLLACVRAGLVILHPDLSYLRSQPTKLFEYMAAGIPVIASDFPFCREVVGGTRCGLLVDPLKPAEVAEAITYVLIHAREAEEMGRRGRQAVEERYSWNKEGDRLLKLYEGLKES